MSRCQGKALLLAAVMGAVPMLASAQIQEIIVTTRKKEESLQDVPIAVTAITAEQIERQGVADLNDIVQNTPSVQFDRSYGPSDTRITIRGLSNTRGRSNVAFLVDSIDVTTENLIVAGSGLLANRRLLTDVQRIEIVKGPQSSLYGRAAFAGAINYVTKEPGDVFEGTAKVDFAEDGFQQVDGAFGGPLSDTLGLRVTGFWYQQDGHYVNTLSGDDVGGSGGSGAAMTAVWRPSDVAKIKVRGEYSKEDYDPLANIRVGGGWEYAPGVRLQEYPTEMLQHAKNMLLGVAVADDRVNGLGFNKGTQPSTGILDFNQYCPPELRTPDAGPGMCQPTTFGRVGSRVVRQSENPLTGQDFDGTDLETARLSVIMEFDLDGGVLTSLSGWTNFDAHDNYDQDWQAASVYKYTPFGGTAADYPATPSPDFYNGRRADQLLAGQIANTDSTVDQFSQELRFSSRLDGAWQYTLGALFWDESRGLDDGNGIFACMPLAKSGALGISGTGEITFPTFAYQPGVCDGGPAAAGETAGQPTLIGWQQEMRNMQPQPTGRWQADTRHWSFYFTVSWELAENWTLEFEDRFVSETFQLLKPNQTLCTKLGYAGVIGQVFPESPRDVDLCPYQKTLDGEGLNSNDTIRSLDGTVTSHYQTPKVTLNWQMTPDNLLYFFWAQAQKPGGINTLSGGGTASVLKDDEFDPEKLQAWEFGTKNTFDVAGPMQANVSLFFQDYTDKQVSTQVVDDQGFLKPKVLNASGAEIWGAEFEFLWQPNFVEGLSLNLAYTYLDAEYSKFVDDVTSPQRLALSNSVGRGCTLLYTGIDANGKQVSSTGFDPAWFNGGISTAAPFDKPPTPVCQVDYGGAKLERTPEHAVALGVSYLRPLLDTGVDLLVEANASWQDKRFLDQDNGFYLDSYWLVNTRIGLVHPKYEIIAYVDNLLDDDTLRSGGTGPDFGRQVEETAFTGGLGVSHTFGTLPDPRIFGVRGTYRFGGK